MVTKCFKADLLTSWCGGSIVSGCLCTWVDCLGRSIGFSNRVVPLCYIPGKLKPDQLGLVRHNNLSLLLIGPFSIPMAYVSYSQGDFVHAHSEPLSGGCSLSKEKGTTSRRNLQFRFSLLISTHISCVNHKDIRRHQGTMTVGRYADVVGLVLYFGSK
jgi:hypothetical protein